ncbi:MAG: micrococcal nuclease [Azospira oryzae]|nr:MAG: micrococcal nuclease [Azospira oryzae]
MISPTSVSFTLNLKIRMRLLTVSLFLFAFSSFAQLSGKVVAVADGDTFTLLTDSKKRIRVRLYGIDCPEKTQDFGVVARKFLADLIFDRQVFVKQKNMDQYGRTIGVVTMNKVNVNEALLHAGLAWHYKPYDRNPEWDVIESNARKAKKGFVDTCQCRCTMAVS